MSEFDLYENQYEEDQLRAYCDAIGEAESLDIKTLCKGINIRKIKPEFRDMVKSIKIKAKIGISEKQLKVLLRAWAYQHMDIETSTGIRDCSESDIY